MSGFVSKLQKLSPKKSRDKFDKIERGFEESNRESSQHFNRQPHQPLGRLHKGNNSLSSQERRSGVSERAHSHSDIIYSHTDEEDDDCFVQRSSDPSQKPPIKAKPRRPGQLNSLGKTSSVDGGFSDSGSVSSLPSVRTLSQRYMPGRRFSETSADSDVFETPSPGLKQKSFDMNQGNRNIAPPDVFQNTPSVDSNVANLNWKSKPTECWTTGDVVEWSKGLGIDKLPKIFQNAGITGTHLSNITDEILVELGLRSMVDRRKFLAEVKSVINRKLSSLWSIKQVSMKRRNLERSTEQLYANLESLQKLNEEQEKKISSSLYEIQQEQLQAKELLTRETTKQSADQSPNSKIEECRKLSDWSTNEAVQWLENNNLAQFVAIFQENGISGKDLDDNNLSFLDCLVGFDTESMESLLSAIYLLQNPQPVATQENDLEKIQTDEDREKYIAALQVAALEGSFSGSVISGSTGTLNNSLSGSTNTLYVSNLATTPDLLRGSRDTLGSTGSVGQLSPNTKSKHAIQRSSPRRTNIYRKNHSTSPDISSSRPKSAPVSRESSAKRPQSELPLPSLFSMLGTDKPVTLMCVKVAAPTNQLDFKVTVRERGLIMVTQTLKNAIPLRKGDRILEAGGQSLGGVESEEEFLEMVKENFLLDMVILREDGEKPSKKEDMETKSEDITVLKNKLTESENQWIELRNVLEELRDMDVGSEEYLKIFPISKMESVKDTVKLEEQLQQLQKTLTNQVTRANSLDRELEAKEQSLKQTEEERDTAVTKLHQLISIIDTDNKGLSYEELDDSVPLWENLRSANKEEVLQALKDNILESTRQKAYLDHLLGVVIDQAPYLLEELEDMEAPEEGAQRTVTRNIPEEWC